MHLYPTFNMFHKLQGINDQYNVGRIICHFHWKINLCVDVITFFFKYHIRKVIEDLICQHVWLQCAPAYFQRIASLQNS